MSIEIYNCRISHQTNVQCNDLAKVDLYGSKFNNAYVTHSVS